MITPQLNELPLRAEERDNLLDFLFEFPFLLEISVGLLKAREPLGLEGPGWVRARLQPAEEEDTHFTVWPLWLEQASTTGIKRSSVHLERGSNWSCKASFAPPM